MLSPSHEFLDAQDLSSYLRVPVATIYGWRYRRLGPPAYRVGRHLRYRKSDVERWLNDHRAQA